MRSLRVGQDYDDRLIFTAADSNGGLVWLDSAGQHGSLDNLADFRARNPGLDLPWADDESKKWVRKRAAGRWTERSWRSFIASGAPEPAHAIFSDLRGHLHDSVDGLSHATETMIVTFIAASYVHALARVVPYLHFVGPPASGKTVAAEFIARTAFGGLHTSGITGPALHRLLDASATTLVIDEYGPTNDALRRVLLAGSQASGQVGLCERNQPAFFRCFGQKVVISNDELKDPALDSRSIRVVFTDGHELRPGRSPRQLESEAIGLRDRLYAFALANASRIQANLDSLGPIPGVANRDRDLAAILVAVARCIDESGSNGVGVEATLVVFFQAMAATRKEGNALDSECLFLAGAALEFIGTPNAKNVRAPDGTDWLLAAEFTDFVNGHADAPARYGARDLGQRLNRYGLIRKRRRVDIAPERNTGDGEAAVSRMQRRAYQFDVANAERLVRER